MGLDKGKAMKKEKKKEINEGMKQKIKVAALLLAGFLMLPSTAMSTDLPNFPFVVAIGETKASVVPDLATITIESQSFEKTSEKALAVVVKASEEILAVLKKHGLDATSFEASDLQKSTKRNVGKSYESLEILGYSVDRYFTIKISNITQYSQITRELIGINNVVGVRSTFDVKKRPEIENRLLTEAISDARQKANALAEGAGSRVVSVYAISQGYNFNKFLATFGADSYEGRVNAGASPLIQGLELFAPRSIDIQQKVNVVYRIE